MIKESETSGKDLRMQSFDTGLMHLQSEGVSEDAREDVRKEVGHRYACLCLKHLIVIIDFFFFLASPLVH